MLTVIIILCVLTLSPEENSSTLDNIVEGNSFREFEDTFDAILDSLNLPRDTPYFRAFLKEYAKKDFRVYPEALHIILLSRMANYSLVVIFLDSIKNYSGIDYILTIREQFQPNEMITFQKLVQTYYAIEQITSYLHTTDIPDVQHPDVLWFISRERDITNIDVKSEVERAIAAGYDELHLVRMIDWDISRKEPPQELQYLQKRQVCVSASIIGPHCATTYRNKKFGVLLSKEKVQVIAGSRDNLHSGMQPRKNCIKQVLKRVGNRIEWLHVDYNNEEELSGGKLCWSNYELIRNVHDYSETNKGHNEVLVNIDWDSVIGLFVVDPSEEETQKLKELANMLKPFFPSRWCAVYSKEPRSHRLKQIYK